MSYTVYTDQIFVNKMLLCIYNRGLFFYIEMNIYHVTDMKIVLWIVCSMSASNAVNKVTWHLS